MPSATYATMALREILKVDTSSLHQASLNSYLLGKKACEKEAPKTDAPAQDGDTHTTTPHATPNESEKTGEGIALEVDSNAETKEEESLTGAAKRKAEDTAEEADGLDKDADADAVAEAKKVKLQHET